MKLFNNKTDSLEKIETVSIAVGLVNAIRQAVQVYLQRNQGSI